MEANGISKRAESNDNSNKKSPGNESESKNLIETTTVTLSKKYFDIPKSESSFNSYSRTCDPHTTDDSDAQSESANSKGKRSLLKHRYLKKNYSSKHQHEHRDHNNNLFKNKNNFYENNMNLHNKHPYHSKFTYYKKSQIDENSNSQNSFSAENPSYDMTNNSMKFSNSIVKPCLVYKNSLTSDEEILSNHVSLISSIKLNENQENTLILDNINNLNEVKQGILKPSNQKENDFEVLTNDNYDNNLSETQQEINNSNSQFRKNNTTTTSSFKPVPKSEKNHLKTKGNSQKTNCKANSNNSINGKLFSNGTNTSGSITLLVDDTRFIVDPEIFKQHSNTMLGRMFNSPLENKPNERGEYAVAYGISSHIFKAILDFYKHGIIRCPPSVSIQELKEACDYLLIPFDGNTVRCHDLRGFLNE